MDPTSDVVPPTPTEVPASLIDDDRTASAAPAADATPPGPHREESPQSNLSDSPQFLEEASGTMDSVHHHDHHDHDRHGDEHVDDVHDAPIHDAADENEAHDEDRDTHHEDESHDDSPQFKEEHHEADLESPIDDEGRDDHIMAHEEGTGDDDRNAAAAEEEEIAAVEYDHDGDTAQAEGHDDHNDAANTGASDTAKVLYNDDDDAVAEASTASHDPVHPSDSAPGAIAAGTTVTGKAAPTTTASRALFEEEAKLLRQVEILRAKAKTHGHFVPEHARFELQREVSIEQSPREDFHRSTPRMSASPRGTASPRGDHANNNNTPRQTNNTPRQTTQNDGGESSAYVFQENNDTPGEGRRVSGDVASPTAMPRASNEGNQNRDVSLSLVRGSPRSSQRRLSNAEMRRDIALHRMAAETEARALQSARRSLDNAVRAETNWSPRRNGRKERIAEFSRTLSAPNRPSSGSLAQSPESTHAHGHAQRPTAAPKFERAATDANSINDSIDSSNGRLVPTSVDLGNTGESAAQQRPPQQVRRLDPHQISSTPSRRVTPVRSTTPNAGGPGTPRGRFVPGGVGPTNPPESLTPRSRVGRNNGAPGTVAGNAGNGNVGAGGRIVSGSPSPSLRNGRPGSPSPSLVRGTSSSRARAARTCCANHYAFDDQQDTASGPNGTPVNCIGNSVGNLGSSFAAVSPVGSHAYPRSAGSTPRQHRPHLRVRDTSIEEQEKIWADAAIQKASSAAETRRQHLAAEARAAADARMKAERHKAQRHDAMERREREINETIERRKLGMAAVNQDMKRVLAIASKSRKEQSDRLIEMARLEADKDVARGAVVAQARARRVAMLQQNRARAQEADTPGAGREARGPRSPARPVSAIENGHNNAAHRNHNPPPTSTSGLSKNSSASNLLAISDPSSASAVTGGRAQRSHSKDWERARAAAHEAELRRIRFERLHTGQSSVGKDDASGPNGAGDRGRDVRAKSPVVSRRGATPPARRDATSEKKRAWEDAVEIRRQELAALKARVAERRAEETQRRERSRARSSDGKKARRAALDADRKVRIAALERERSELSTALQTAV